MKRILLIGVLFVLLFLEASGQERKKVALVLGGGGAKGMAHIGAIEVLEDAGIPVDYVVGTSIGSIVGGLYAIGYDAQTLKNMVRSQDWSHLLSDRVLRENLAFYEKESAECFLFSVPFGTDRKALGGMVYGQNLMNLFTDLTIGYHDSLDYNTLPRPFCCVATNVVDGREVDMHSGDLSRSMRASMAIPGAFTPMEIDSLILVDGGMVNNFPIDVARKMGADIVIGIDVSSELRNQKKLGTFVEIAGQLLDILCMNKYEENVEQTDLYIHPDVSGFSSASFNAEAIDSLLKRGRIAAEKKKDAILALKKQIGIIDTTEIIPVYRQVDSIYIKGVELIGISSKNEQWIRRMIHIKDNSLVEPKDIERIITTLYGTRRFRSVSYKLLDGPKYVLQLKMEEDRSNFLNVGFRFDSQDLAAILLNSKLNIPAFRSSKVELAARLNACPYFKCGYTLGNPRSLRMLIEYMFQYNDYNIYKEGDKLMNVVYQQHHIGWKLSDVNFRNFKAEFGTAFDNYSFDRDASMYSSTVVGKLSEDDIYSNKYYSYYGAIHYETFDRRYYPTRGSAFRLEADLYTCDGLKYREDKAPVLAYSYNFETLLNITRRFKLLPSLAGRIIVNDPDFVHGNWVGGSMEGRYLPQQMVFYGIPRMELISSSAIIGRLHFRQRAGEKHYLSLIANGMYQDNDFFDMWKTSFVYGGACSYSYDSAAGPIEIQFNWSNYTNSVGFYFNFGFNF